MLLRNVAGEESDQPSSADSKMVFGERVSRKTLFYLISTLNASFYPDYDFSTAEPQEFSKEPCLEVRFTMICHLSEFYFDVTYLLFKKALNNLSICLLSSVAFLLFIT